MRHHNSDGSGGPEMQTAPNLEAWLSPEETEDGTPRVVCPKCRRPGCPITRKTYATSHEGATLEILDSAVPDVLGALLDGEILAVTVCVQSGCGARAEVLSSLGPEGIVVVPLADQQVH